MSEIKITIPGEMPGFNKIVAAAKTHYAAYAKMKKDNTETVSWIVCNLPRKERIFLDITWYCKDKRRDPDNIAAAVKFIWDGLVDGGVIENDGWKENKGWSNTFEVDKENPRIEVVIRAKS